MTSTANLGGMVADVAGSGDPVVMVHGLGGSSSTFEPQLEVFSDKQTIRPELRGSARSRSPEGGLSIGGFAEALLRLLGDLDLEQAHFVAHSMGTIVCQHMAVSHPARVRSLALLGVLTEPPAPAREALRQRAVKARSEGMSEIAEAIVGGSVSSAARHDNPAAAAFVRESILRQCAEGYAQTCEALAEAEAADAARVACPTLLITGDEDPIAPASVARALGERIEAARVVILNRCGHWATVERPREVNRALKDFYASRAR